MLETLHLFSVFWQVWFLAVTTDHWKQKLPLSKLMESLFYRKDLVIGNIIEQIIISIYEKECFFTVVYVLCKF